MPAQSNSHNYVPERFPAAQNRLSNLVLIGLLSVIGAFPNAAIAQWYFNVGATASYDDNPLAIAESQSSSIWKAELGADKVINTFGVGYSAEYLHYDQMSRIDAILGSGYFSYSNDTTSIGVVIDHRTSTEEQLYDYLGANAVGTHRIYLGGLISSVQLAAGLYRFPVLVERDRQFVSGGVSTIKSFPSRTTVIARIGLGHTVYTSTPMVDENPSVWQWNGSLRVAQSLTPTTGIAVQGLVRRLDGSSPVGYTIEEDSISYALLDDPSLYSIRTVSSELTQMLFGYSLTIRLGASYSNREYLTQGSYLDETSYSEDERRTDDLLAAWITAAYDLRSSGPDIDIRFSAQWADNESTSYWYSYSGSYLSLGLQYNF